MKKNRRKKTRDRKKKGARKAAVRQRGSHRLSTLSLEEIKKVLGGRFSSVQYNLRAIQSGSWCQVQTSDKHHHNKIQRLLKKQILSFSDMLDREMAQGNAQVIASNSVSPKAEEKTPASKSKTKVVTPQTVVLEQTHNVRVAFDRDFKQLLAAIPSIDSVLEFLHQHGAKACNSEQSTKLHLYCCKRLKLDFLALKQEYLDMPGVPFSLTMSLIDKLTQQIQWASRLKALLHFSSGMSFCNVMNKAYSQIIQINFSQCVHCLNDLLNTLINASKTVSKRDDMIIERLLEVMELAMPNFLDLKRQDPSLAPEWDQLCFGFLHRVRFLVDRLQGRSTDHDARVLNSYLRLLKIVGDTQYGPIFNIIEVPVDDTIEVPVDGTRPMNTCYFLLNFSIMLLEYRHKMLLMSMSYPLSLNEMRQYSREIHACIKLHDKIRSRVQESVGAEQQNLCQFIISKLNESLNRLNVTMMSLQLSFFYYFLNASKLNLAVSSLNQFARYVCEQVHFNRDLKGMPDEINDVKNTLLMALVNVLEGLQKEAVQARRKLKVVDTTWLLLLDTLSLLSLGNCDIQWEMILSVTETVMRYKQVNAESVSPLLAEAVFDCIRQCGALATLPPLGRNLMFRSCSIVFASWINGVVKSCRLSQSLFQALCDPAPIPAAMAQHFRQKLPQLKVLQGLCLKVMALREQLINGHEESLYSQVDVPLYMNIQTGCHGLLALLCVFMQTERHVLTASSEIELTALKEYVRLLMVQSHDETAFDLPVVMKLIPQVNVIGIGFILSARMKPCFVNHSIDFAALALFYRVINDQFKNFTATPDALKVLGSQVLSSVNLEVLRLVGRQSFDSTVPVSTESLAKLLQRAAILCDLLAVDVQVQHRCRAASAAGVALVERVSEPVVTVSESKQSIASASVTDVSESGPKCNSASLSGKVSCVESDVVEPSSPASVSQSRIRGYSLQLFQNVSGIERSMRAVESVLSSTVAASS